MPKDACVELNAGDLPRGFRFGSYVIQSLIGRGAMARVYRAEHEGLRKPVALKVMERALLERQNGSHRFLREGQAAAAVKHPNVVDITDVGVWEELPYLVMELLEGQDLDLYLSSRGPLSEAQTARLMLPVIAGLQAAHRCGIVHRDLKPANIFLARGPQGDVLPKILDFGISKLADPGELDLARTAEGELMGSPLYMSPEAVKGARDLTEQTDQYSLGVIIYECLTGRLPFEHDHLLPLLNAVASGDFPAPRELRPGLSPGLDAAIVKAMSLEPAARFGSVRELGCALWEVADGRSRLLWSPSFSDQALVRADSTPVLSIPPESAMAVATTYPQLIGALPSTRPSMRSVALPLMAAAVLGALGVGVALVQRGDRSPPSAPSSAVSQPGTDSPALSPASSSRQAAAGPTRGEELESAPPPIDVEESLAVAPSPTPEVPSEPQSEARPPSARDPGGSASLPSPPEAEQRGSESPAGAPGAVTSKAAEPPASRPAPKPPAARPAPKPPARRPAPARAKKPVRRAKPRPRAEAAPPPRPAAPKPAPVSAPRPSLGANDSPILD